MKIKSYKAILIFAFFIVCNSINGFSQKNEIGINIAFVSYGGQFISPNYANGFSIQDGTSVDYWIAYTRLLNNGLSDFEIHIGYSNRIKTIYTTNDMYRLNQDFLSTKLIGHKRFSLNKGFVNIAIGSGIYMNTLIEETKENLHNNTTTGKFGNIANSGILIDTKCRIQVRKNQIFMIGTQLSFDLLNSIENSNLQSLTYSIGYGIKF